MLSKTKCKLNFNITMKNILILGLSLFMLQSCSKSDSDLSPTGPNINYGEFTDERDGSTYKTIEIGGQTWMSENLRYRLPRGSYEGCYTYSEADIVLTQLSVNTAAYADSVNAALARGEIVNPPGMNPATSGPVYELTVLSPYFTPSVMINRLVTYPDAQKVIIRINNNLLVPASENQAQVNLKNADNTHNGYSSKFGFMYKFDAAQKAIPAGWRLPTDEDWKELEKNLGMSNSDAELLNAWRGNAANKFLANTNQSSGFDALHGGARVYGSFAYGTPFMNKDVSGYYWTSTVVQNSDETELAIIREFMRNNNGVWRGTSRKEAAYHIRLIKNN